MSNESSRQLEEVKIELLNTLGTVENYKAANLSDSVRFDSKQIVKSLYDNKPEVKSDSAN